MLLPLLVHEVENHRLTRRPSVGLFLNLLHGFRLNFGLLVALGRFLFLKKRSAFHDASLFIFSCFFYLTALLLRSSFRIFPNLS